MDARSNPAVTMKVETVRVTIAECAENANKACAITPPVEDATTNVTTWMFHAAVIVSDV